LEQIHDEKRTSSSFLLELFPSDSLAMALRTSFAADHKNEKKKIFRSGKKKEPAFPTFIARSQPPSHHRQVGLTYTFLLFFLSFFLSFFFFFFF